MAGKFFRFGYFSHGANAHAAWKPHDLRDAEAFAFIADVLASTKGGLRYGGPILNHPPPEKVLIEQLGASPNQPPSRRIQVQEPEWSKDDVVVLTTRPPLTDREWGYTPRRRIIHRSWTTLEDRVFATLAPHFRACSRKEIYLSDALRLRLPESLRNRATAEFRMEAWAGEPHLRSAYYALGSGPPLTPTDPAWGWSPVFLVSSDVESDSWPGGPGRVLAAWGIGEVETLVFARMLNAPQLQHLLDGRPRFFMGEFQLQPVDPQSLDFSFANGWTLRHLLHVDPRPPHALLALPEHL